MIEPQSTIPIDQEQLTAGVNYKSETIQITGSGNERYEFANPLHRLGWQNGRDIQSFQSAATALVENDEQESLLASVLHAFSDYLSEVQNCLEVSASLPLESYQEVRRGFLASYESYLVTYRSQNQRSQSETDLNKLLFSAVVEVMKEPVSYNSGRSKTVASPITARPLGDRGDLSAMVAVICRSTLNCAPTDLAKNDALNKWDGSVDLSAEDELLDDPDFLENAYGKPLAVWMPNERTEEAAVPLEYDLQQVKDLLADATLPEIIKKMLPAFYSRDDALSAYQAIIGEAATLPERAVGVEYFSRDISFRAGSGEAEELSATSIRSLSFNLRQAAEFLIAINDRGKFMLDLKPQNIRLSEKGEVVFSDLGSLIELEKSGANYRFKPDDSIWAAENNGLQVLKDLLEGRAEIGSIDPNLLQVNAFAVLILATIARAFPEMEVEFRKTNDLPVAQKIEGLRSYLMAAESVETDVKELLLRFLQQMQPLLTAERIGQTSLGDLKKVLDEVLQSR